MSSVLLSLLDELRGREIELEPGILYRPVEAVSPELRARIAEHKLSLLRVLIDGVVDQPDVASADVKLAPATRFLATAQLVSPTIDVHERPQHGCYHCGRRMFVLMRGGPLWLCPTCTAPKDLSGVIETWEAPEPSLREQMGVGRARRTEVHDA